MSLLKLQTVQMTKESAFSVMHKRSDSSKMQDHNYKKKNPSDQDF